MTLFEMTYEAEPVPFQRPRFFGKRSFNDPRYNQYKKNLASMIRHQLAKTPCSPIQEPVAFYAKYYRSTKHVVDLDNLVKATLDAAQDAGLLVDDKFVETLTAKKLYDKARPRVEFWFEAMKKGCDTCKHQDPLWRPIETVPKDGTEVLLCALSPSPSYCGHAVTIGYYDTEANPDYPWHTFLDGDDQRNAAGMFTYWMPLPLPPEDTNE